MLTSEKIPAAVCVAVLIMHLYMLQVFSDEWTGISDEVQGRINVVEPIDGTDTVYIGTDHGLYRSKDLGEAWQKIDASFDIAPVSGIALGGEDIYVVTKGALFVGKNGLKWSRVSGLKNVRGVTSDAGDVRRRAVVAWDDRRLFLVGNKGIKEITPAVFRGRIGKAEYKRGAIIASSGSDVWRSMDMGATWKKLTETDSLTDTDPMHEIGQVAEEGVLAPVPLRDINTDGVVTAVVTREGIHLIRGTETPVIIDTEGLPAEGVKHVAVRGNMLLAATGTRVFAYSGEASSWYTVFDKAASGGIGGIAVSRDSGGRDRLWVAGRDKVFTSGVASLLPGDVESLPHFKEEYPSIQEVHRMAIEYAEVSPEKIKNWRRGARWKAFMPRLSVGISQSIDDNIEIYKNSSTSYVVNGPQEIGTDWDVDLTWDLSRLVWNSEQTSIDVRSKLMVQLRDEILEEVTRLYYERKRLIEEVRGKSAESKKRIRIEELTAYIDAYTGGAFSAYAKK